MLLLSQQVYQAWIKGKDEHGPFELNTYKQGNRVANELRMLFDNLLDPLLLNVLSLVLLQVQDDLCSTANWLTYE